MKIPLGRKMKGPVILGGEADMPHNKAEKNDEEQIMHPHAYIDHDGDHEMKLGQKVKLHGKITEVHKREDKDGSRGGFEVELHHCETDGDGQKAPSKHSDKENEDDIEGGLDKERKEDM